MGVGTGAAAGAGLGSIIPGVGTLAGAGIGALGGWLFGRHGDKDKPEGDETDPYTKALQGSADRLGKQGADLSATGMDALGPVAAYFQKLMSGNPAALMDATKPQRGRVIDQYDAARNAVANFSPRGGGSAQAMTGLRIAEANQLSDITADAQSGAATSLANLGTALTGLGLSAEQLKSQDLNSIISAVLANKGIDTQNRGQNLEALTGAGEALGTILGLVFTRGQQAA